MSDDAPPLTTTDTSDPARRSLVEDVSHLIGDARTYAEAELQFQKARAGIAGAGIRNASVLVVFAIAFVLLALLALTVGLLLALAPLIGSWLAMLAVTLGLLVCGFACLLLARSHWRGTVKLFEASGKDVGDE